MGGGSWDRASYTTYSASVGRSVSLDGSVSGTYSAQDMFSQRGISSELNPMNVIRECCDSEEHPNTFPVILGLDVTGSMGDSAVEVAKKLNVIMTKLYENVSDVEFMIMGIGDLAYDSAPIQASQFESDIRIAEQLDKIWFEGCGGGNSYESYTAAWYFGTRHAKLDCWNRGKKGLIITMGDEIINPYLPSDKIKRFVGDNLQGDVETADLYREASEKYDIYHLVVDHGYYSHMRADENAKSFEKYLGKNNVKTVTLQDISDVIIDIVMSVYDGNGTSTVNESNDSVVGTISW